MLNSFKIFFVKHSFIQIRQAVYCSTRKKKSDKVFLPDFCFFYAFCASLFSVMLPSLKRIEISFVTPRSCIVTP